MYKRCLTSRLRIFRTTAGPALLILPVAAFCAYFGGDQGVLLDGGQQMVQAAMPAALRQMFWLLLVIVSAVIAFWTGRLALRPRALGRAGAVVGAVLWLVGAGATVLLVIHLAQELFAKWTTAQAPLSGVEVFVLTSFGAFGAFQGTQHFLYKLKGAPDGWIDNGLRPRWSAVGGIIAGELHRRKGKR